jgi:hypothetical protein
LLSLCHAATKCHPISFKLYQGQLQALLLLSVSMSIAADFGWTAPIYSH